jgi:hypothetical protein
MRIVMRAVLTRYAISPARPEAEPTGRRSITFSPGRGTTVVLHERQRIAPAPPAPEELAAA